MRDPATRIDDPEVEAAIEETRQFLERDVSADLWAGDQDPRHGALLKAIAEIRGSSLSEKTKLLADDLFVKAMRKRSKKPTRRWRDFALWVAAQRLVPRYRLSRNDETFHTQSATSIVQQALTRLGVTMTEKQLKDIVLKKKSDIVLNLTVRVRENPRGA